MIILSGLIWLSAIYTRALAIFRPCQIWFRANRAYTVAICCLSMYMSLHTDHSVNAHVSNFVRLMCHVTWVCTSKRGQSGILSPYPKYSSFGSQIFLCSHISTNITLSICSSTLVFYTHIYNNIIIIGLGRIVPIQLQSVVFLCICHYIQTTALMHMCQIL